MLSDRCDGCDKVQTMFFDAATLEMVRKANAEERYDVLYVMVPADDGDQSYNSPTLKVMKCKICGEFDNMMASKFSHAEGVRE